MCEGVECYFDKFVLGTFRKTFNDESKRLNFNNLYKHLKKNIKQAYDTAKEEAVEVRAHCPQFLHTNPYVRAPLCKDCAHKVREVEAKFNSFPVKNGWKLYNTALFRILTAQAAYERKNSSKRPSQTGLEDVSASKAEGIPRKLSKSESSTSVLNIVEEDSEEKENEEADLSLTL